MSAETHAIYGYPFEHHTTQHPTGAGPSLTELRDGLDNSIHTGICLWCDEPLNDHTGPEFRDCLLAYLSGKPVEK